MAAAKTGDPRRRRRVCNLLCAGVLAARPLCGRARQHAEARRPKNTNATPKQGIHRAAAKNSSRLRRRRVGTLPRAHRGVLCSRVLLVLPWQQRLGGPGLEGEGDLGALACLQSALPGHNYGHAGARRPKNTNATPKQGTRWSAAKNRQPAPLRAPTWGSSAGVSSSSSPGSSAWAGRVWKGRGTSVQWRACSPPARA
jgi:hypothetical protein